MAETTQDLGGLVFDINGSVATLRLDRPTKLNTMTPEMGRELAGLVTRINDDDEIRVIVLTGTGERAFSAGSDVAVLDQYGTNWQLRNRVDYARMIWTIRKPVIAAVAGFARTEFSGGQSKLEGAAYFRFFTWLILGTAVLYIPFACLYRPKSYLHS